MAGKKCVVLLSGGLDSLLALRLMTVLGIDAIAMHSVNSFHGTEHIREKKQKIEQSARALGATSVQFPDLTNDVLELTKHPQHGYGKHLNACIDCRLRTVREGFRVMEENNADFVVTGEVVGQRPMSQRKDAIDLADRLVAKWGYAGLLLRPLTAKLLPTTIPEQNGWVDPNMLYAISGRGREKQIELAAELDLQKYPTPAGGCLLTDPGFSQRLAVLFRFTPEWNASDVELLKLGRHFQISEKTRIIVSRCEEENYALRDLARPQDMFYINHERNGAIAMIRGEATPQAIEYAAGLAVHYSKMRENGAAQVAEWRVENNIDVYLRVFPAGIVSPEQAREIELPIIGKNSLKLMREAARKKNRVDNEEPIIPASR